MWKKWFSRMLMLCVVLERIRKIHEKKLTVICVMCARDGRIMDMTWVDAWNQQSSHAGKLPNEVKNRAQLNWYFISFSDAGILGHAFREKKDAFHFIFYDKIQWKKCKSLADMASHSTRMTSSCEHSDQKKMSWQCETMKRLGWKRSETTLMKYYAKQTRRGGKKRDRFTCATFCVSRKWDAGA